MIDDSTIEKLVADPGSLEPRCMVCGELMPKDRAKDSKRTTCSPECYKRMKAFRKEMTRRRFCPSCLHPSTPAQREDYKHWQTERGFRKGNREDGRPPRKREKLLEGALGEIVAALKDVQGFEVPMKSGEDSEEQRVARVTRLETAIAATSKLLDPTPVK